MKKNIYVKIIYVLVAVLLTTMLSGCAEDEQITQDERNQQLIAEYAAGVLLKYKKEHEPTKKPTEIPTEEPVPEQEAPKEDGKEKENNQESEIPDATVSEIKDATGGGNSDCSNIADALMLEGFDIKYSGYEVCDVYPKQEGNDLFFSMQASEGKHLIVTHFDVTNTTAEDKLCDALGCSVKYRLLVNDTVRINEQMTILLNDLKSYSDTIAAGATTDTVLVFETEDDVASNIDKLSLLLVTDSGELTFRCE